MRAFFVFGCVTVLFCASVATAAVDTAIIRLFVGVDTTPPSTPALLVATPQSTSTIMVTWSAAVDDVAVSGYRVYRDTVFVATTTATLYADTNLVQNTTYSYEIEAFDHVFNLATKTPPVATTTFATPLAPPASSAANTATKVTPPAVTGPVEITVVPSQSSALVTVRPSQPAQMSLLWGRTPDGELGSIASPLWQQSYQTVIPRLEPGTVYYVRVRLLYAGGAVDEETVSFRTAPALTTSLPANVTFFTNQVLPTGILLSWSPPRDPTARVRLVRSHLGYPQNQTDGDVLYEGTDTSFLDTTALLGQSRYFYSLFVITADDRVSTGAVTVATLGGGVDVVTEVAEGSDPQKSTWQIEPDTIVVISSTTRSTFTSPQTLPVNAVVLFSIPKTAVPPTLKTILLSVSNPTNNLSVTTYLFKLNPEGTAYETTILTSPRRGEGTFLIEVIDFETAVVTSIKTPVTYVDSSPVPFPWWLLVVSVGIFCLVSWYWFLLKQRREDNR